ncbi:hypothetical protein D3C78_911980 [compost metagenome]
MKNRSLQRKLERVKRCFYFTERRHARRQDNRLAHRADSGKQLDIGNVAASDLESLDSHMVQRLRASYIEGSGEEGDVFSLTNAHQLMEFRI